MKWTNKPKCSKVNNSKYTAVYTVDQMVVDNIGTIGAVIVGGFIGGLLLGYALKKVVKLISAPL
jgi:uncharacterized membrane protein (Fun14 family)